MHRLAPCHLSGVPLVKDLDQNQALLRETDELIRNFFASIPTAQSKQTTK